MSTDNDEMKQYLERVEAMEREMDEIKQLSERVDTMERELNELERQRNKRLDVLVREADETKRKFGRDAQLHEPKPELLAQAIEAALKGLETYGGQPFMFTCIRHSQGEDSQEDSFARFEEHVKGTIAGLREHLKRGFPHKEFHIQLSPDQQLLGVVPLAAQ